MMSPMFRLFRFNSVQSNVPFLHPLKTSENLLGFLMFSGVVKREHQREMGEESILFQYFLIFCIIYCGMLGSVEENGYWYEKNLFSVCFSFL